MIHGRKISKNTIMTQNEQKHNNDILKRIKIYSLHVLRPQGGGGVEGSKMMPVYFKRAH